MAQVDTDVENHTLRPGKWRLVCNLGDGLYIMGRHVSDGIAFAPFFVLKFPLLLPHFIAESEMVNIAIDNVDEAEIADKLRWHRHRNGLLQSDLAEQLGIDRGRYLSYEQYGRDYYPIEHLRKLAEIFCIPETDLFDDYHAFLAGEPNKRIRAKRVALGMTQKEFANVLGSSKDQVQSWELGRFRVTKENWEKYFKSFL